MSKKALPKLPPLPRMKKMGALPRPKSPKDAAELPYRPPLEDEVTPIEGSFGEQDTERHRADDTGRWFETGKKAGQVGGRCWKCGRRRKAENLRAYQRPFGKGEVWICKEGC